MIIFFLNCKLCSCSFCLISIWNLNLEIEPKSGKIIITFAQWREYYWWASSIFSLKFAVDGPRLCLAVWVWWGTWCVSWPSLGRVPPPCSVSTSWCSAWLCSTLSTSWWRCSCSGCRHYMSSNQALYHMDERSLFHSGFGWRLGTPAWCLSCCLWPRLVWRAASTWLSPSVWRDTSLSSIPSSR